MKITNYCRFKAALSIFVKPTITDMKKDIKDLKAGQREQIKLQRTIIRRLDGHHFNPVDAAAGVDADGAHEPQHFEEPQPLEQRSEGFFFSDPKDLVLPAPPAVFEIEDGISVETAWHGWHGTYHNKETGGGPSMHNEGLSCMPRESK